MFNFVSKALFTMVFVAALSITAPALAGSLAILDSLNTQNASVSVLSQETMDSSRAKYKYYFTMTYGDGAEAMPGRSYEYEYYDQNTGALFGRATYVEAIAGLKDPRSGNTGEDFYYVSIGSEIDEDYLGKPLFSIHTATDTIEVQYAGRSLVMNIPFFGLDAWGIFGELPRGNGEMRYNLPFNYNAVTKVWH